MSWKKLTHFSMKLHLNKIQGPKQLLGFDLGKLSTGVAISCYDLKYSYYLTTIQASVQSQKFADLVCETIRKNKVAGVVFGDPTFYPAQSENMRKIVGKIESNLEKWKIDGCEIPYCFVDENWTTKRAKNQLSYMKKVLGDEGHIKKEKDIIDGIAAIYILKKFLALYNKR